MSKTVWQKATVSQMRETMAAMRRLFGYVRLVDPVTMSVIQISEQDELMEEKHCCYKIWGKEGRCSECSSLCALNQKAISFKSEASGQTPYHVVSVPMQLQSKNGEARKLVLELASSVANPGIGHKPKALIVEDQPINRALICKALEDTYTCIEAENGIQALKLLKNEYDVIDVILLDLVMPVMDGFETMQALTKDGRFSNIPILAITGDPNEETEKKCLATGAWDFVAKPLDPQLLKLRLQSIVSRSRMYAANHPNALAEHDQLTGLYNRTRFFKATRQYINRTQEQQVLVRFDVDKFRMYNAYFGEEEGDRLLRYIADSLREIAAQLPSAVFGRIEADVFCLCFPFREEAVQQLVEQIAKRLKQYKSTYYIEPSIGIYPVVDKAMSVETMYTCASLAAERCKNRYMTYSAYYDPRMSEQMAEAQEIMNEAPQALKEEQFKVYLQPKYNIQTNQPYGAEALVRWAHPHKGMISPGVFIPVFEANGFVGRLDYYMWEHVCRLLRQWMDAGLNPAPISVNVSRANLYNPDFADLISGLAAQYGVPNALLNLEITESAYMENPEMMIRTVQELQQRGFIILMDDFGSGYSSLNTLKDIPVDVLKIDMKFLQNGGHDGRGERILASISRMAGWLDLPVVVEGVETREQRDFLEAIGCGYIQGYFYAKPMPVEEYETLLQHPQEAKVLPAEKAIDSVAIVNAIWNASPAVSEIFETIREPVCVYECVGELIIPMRENEAFQHMFGAVEKGVDLTEFFRRDMLEDDFINLRYAFARAKEQTETVECSFTLFRQPKRGRHMRVKLHCVQQASRAAAVLAIFEDITAQDALERELRRLCAEKQPERQGILIVDDSEVSRSVLSEMFCGQYDILQASNGKQAQQVLREHGEGVAVILLDMLMPEMDGEAFLRWKRTQAEIADIPVVVISAEQREAVQLQMLELGVNDYVTKPFVPEIVIRRVKNVLEYDSRFRRLLKEYRKREQA